MSAGSQVWSESREEAAIELLHVPQAHGLFRRVQLDDVARADIALAPAAARLASRVSWAGMGAAAAVGVLAPGPLARAGWMPLALGLVAGLPHGAVDHLVPQRLSGGRPTMRTMSGLLGAYVGLAGAFFLFARLAPSVALLVFIAASIVHFGTGEVAFAAQRARRPARFAPQLVLGAGAPPLLVPLALRPDEVAPLVADLAPGLGWLLAPGLRWALLLVAAASVTAAIVTLLGVGDRRAAAETGAVAVAFAVAPPLLVFAAYFGAWHATRHVARLLSTDPGARTALAEGRVAPGLLRFARQAALPTLAAATTLALLWWGAGGTRGFVAANLGLLAALTMPHMVIVAQLDRAGRGATVAPGAGRPGVEG